MVMLQKSSYIADLKERTEFSLQQSQICTATCKTWMQLYASARVRAADLREFRRQDASGTEEEEEEEEEPWIKRRGRCMS